MSFKNMVDSGYFMYMAEQEGLDSLVNTRTSKVNAAIKDFQKIINSGENPYDYIDSVLANHGLTQDMLTDEECDRIGRLGR